MSCDQLERKFSNYLTRFNYTLHSIQCSNAGDEISQLNCEIIDLSLQIRSRCITKKRRKFYRVKDSPANTPNPRVPYPKTSSY